MTDERRYSDDEVAEIFREAAHHPQPEPGTAVARDAGLGLGELQAIGARVGLAPERVAEAAAALELRRGRGPRGTHLGLPVTVGRTVELPRAPTEREWEVLVAELRATFGVHGRDVSHGGVRGWRIGRLHAYVEPTGTGHRLRLGTTKGDAAALGGIGIAGVAAGVLQLALAGGAGAAGPALLLAGIGSAALAANALRLPAWASRREAQMDRIAACARALLVPDAAA